jgi:hypothetical protein
MRWLSLVITYIRVFFGTLEYARYMSPERRQKVAKLVKELATLRGWDIYASDRREYSFYDIEAAPQKDGIYRIFDGDELVYVGAAWGERGLRARLKAHLWESESNTDLATFLASGDATLDWYLCQVAGWMEDYELTEHQTMYGGLLPRYNNRQADAVFRAWRWW